MKIETNLKELSLLSAIMNSMPVSGVAQMRLANKAFEQFDLDSVQTAASKLGENFSILAVPPTPISVEIDESVRRFIIESISKAQLPSAALARIALTLLDRLGPEE